MSECVCVCWGGGGEGVGGGLLLNIYSALS